VKKTASSQRSLWILLLFIVLFIGPMVAAWWLFNHGGSAKTTNHGVLIQPPLQLHQLQLYDSHGRRINTSRLSGKWWIFYIYPQPTCDQACYQNLHDVRQVWRAIGKDNRRVRRAIITFVGQPTDIKLAAALARQYMGTAHFIVNKMQLQRLMARLPSKKLALTRGYLYLVDPLGNIMLSYNQAKNPMGFYQDIKRLLRASQIG